MFNDPHSEDVFGSEQEHHKQQQASFSTTPQPPRMMVIHDTCAGGILPTNGTPNRSRRPSSSSCHFRTCAGTAQLLARTSLVFLNPSLFAKTSTCGRSTYGREPAGLGMDRRQMVDSGQDLLLCSTSRSSAEKIEFRIQHQRSSAVRS